MQIGESVYLWHKVYFMPIVIQCINVIKDQISAFMDVSNPIWYLERSDSKCSLITLSALPLIMILGNHSLNALHALQNIFRRYKFNWQC